MSKILEVKKLTKIFNSQKRNIKKQFRAVDSISFSVQEGEILGLLGPNGAGKTTTIQMLLGALTPTSGEIYYFGKPFSGTEDPALNKINFASGYANIPSRLTIKENLTVFAHFYQVANYQDKIKRLATEFEVQDLLNKPLTQLSSGQKTRVMLMKAMINYPHLLLLDEPTASLDPDISQKVRQFLLSQREKYNVSLLFTSHNMNEIQEICDRVIFLNQGKIVAEDTPMGILKKMKRTYIRMVIIRGESDLIGYSRDNHFDLSFKKGKALVKIDEEVIPKFLYEISGLGVRYSDIEILRPQLEDFFLQVAKENITECGDKNEPNQN
ncbi:ABC transporter ATP-binding protein [candidate division WWE3 bacterium CG06_land_8_20_14_3_00_42_16]|uniref:ABC transporter ATP-binding protein n=2 Tax=Katanobacteria TaxID=422282 RepID=A0A2M7ANS4_UNCKA|nr:MAG: ABC transporter ATP-binding protein [candidate division WWE3 bacterium CG06_land_8_20_14_3_00_42_16]